MQAIGSCSMSTLQRPAVACCRTAHRPPSHRRPAPSCPSDRALKRGASYDLHTAVRRATAHTAAVNGHGSRRRVPSMFKQSERFTANAKLAVKKAQAEGCKLGKNYAGPEHLLLGLLAADDGLPAVDQGVAARVLEAHGVTLKLAREGVEAVSGADGLGLTQQIVEIPLSGKGEAALRDAISEARRLGMPYNSVGTEHLLLGMLRDEKGPVVRLLNKLGADVAAIQAEVLRLTLEETEARLPGSEERPRSSGVQKAAQLAFVPLAAAAYVLVRQANQAVAVAAAAAVLSLVTVFMKARARKGRGSLLSAVFPGALLPAVAAALGAWAGQAAAAALRVEPGLVLPLTCAAGVLAGGLGTYLA